MLLETILIAFYVVVCIALIVIVLLQSGKGEGLAGVFGGGSQTIFGARTGDVLTKTTTVLAILFMCLSLALALLSTRTDRSLGDEISRAAAQMPAAPSEGAGSAEGAVPAPGQDAPVPGAGGAAAPDLPAAAATPAL